ncbi:hypothetical protein FIBSPDRAFT_829115 [Athelia psychrophila]|uniref:Uncharacterized protein n=1 Tax=Athelia psychrophila TaxID=1759441 RepID=A0A166H6W9_9AGAM|nr:hypothetical protein FIBSPDRAFT_829115 [Fibularhizoctonia sp. CBS 109695]
MSFAGSNVASFSGVVNTTIEALCLVEAARQGKIPRLIRRLGCSEREGTIKSGAVFVFGVEESGIKRWTDFKLWSPSRIDGNFLVSVRIPFITKCYQDRRNGQKSESHTQSCRETIESNCLQSSPALRRKTITISTDGGDFHVVSYAAHDDILAGRLDTIASTAEIETICLNPSRFLLSRFRYPPKVIVSDCGLTSIR